MGFQNPFPHAALEAAAEQPLVPPPHSHTQPSAPWLCSDAAHHTHLSVQSQTNNPAARHRWVNSIIESKLLGTLTLTVVKHLGEATLVVDEHNTLCPDWRMTRLDEVVPAGEAGRQSVADSSTTVRSRSTAPGAPRSSSIPRAPLAAKTRAAGFRAGADPGQSAAVGQ
jgi:hypothetical protein